MNFGTSGVLARAKQFYLKARGRSSEQDTRYRTLEEEISRRPLTVLSNREPYIHQRREDVIEVLRPASGVVSALEPVLRRCGGLWIASGSGSADWEVADANGEVRVPPADPTYTLRRIRLSKEEETNYYYGFSNEGLWPLCHLAHTRPVFRAEDWAAYQTVNARFAAAIPEERLRDRALVLVQDFHLALAPRLIRERVLAQGGAAPCLGIFWHIPWPNPEAFGICPWARELLRGMLGADVIGFHTQYHCNNFLETCNRYLEARVDLETFSVTMEQHETRVRAIPIGIDTAPVRALSEAEKAALKERYGIPQGFVAIGVDRFDYTKGLIERPLAVEKFLDDNPRWIENFTFVQMGTPSRSELPAYRQVVEELEKTIARVNAKYVAQGARPPIILLSSHHEWDEIQYFYQLGDLCMVTSLHDGMNLVAKEYVWCQKPERGSLLLSKFAGASRELTEAFLVNPYSIEEVASAIAAATNLTPEQRAERMTAMKRKVQAHDAVGWAAGLIRVLGEEPPPQPELRHWPPGPSRSSAARRAAGR